MEGLYPDSPAKVAFVMAVGRQAKDHLVSEYGIGEELAINLVGWVGDELACLAQMDMQFGDPKDEDERSERIWKTSTIMRRGWGCDSFTLLAEGWVSTKPEKTRKKDLQKEFASGKKKTLMNACLFCTWPTLVKRSTFALYLFQ